MPLSTTPTNDAQHAAESDTESTAPRGVLTWRSPSERNKLLDTWRLAVFAMFGEQSRCIRLAWVLANLFNARTGYAFASNGWLAKNTLIAENKLREALAALEAGGAILRVWIPRPNGEKQRVIYPATGILPRPTVGHGGEPQQVGHQNLSKRPRLPKTQLDYARLAASTRRDGEAARRGSASPPSKRGH
jgi:hypothetical protein